MRVSHLLEAVDYSPLTKIWKSSLVIALIEQLRHMADDEAMMADILEKASMKYADSAPEKLLDFIKPLIDISKHATTPARSYDAVLRDFLNDTVAVVLKMESAAIKKLKSKVNIDELSSLIDHELSTKLRLMDWKISRTKKQEKEDRDNQLYVFVGRPTFKEEPKGSGNFKKTLEIEKLVPIDRFDQQAHQMVGMMKIRARFQGENSEVYMVTLPKMAHDPADDLPEWLIPLIDEHKKKVTT